MKVILIRHGETAGNIRKKYIGRTDEPLCEAGKAELKSKSYPQADIIIASPMRRCMETAEIIYGGYDDVFDGLKECDFGRFENKSFEELKNDSDYQKWLDSGGTMAFPLGESMKSFSERCIKAFRQAVEKYKNYETLAFVVHGGTIMAVARDILGGNFYDYHLKNGEYMIILL